MAGMRSRPAAAAARTRRSPVDELVAVEGLGDEDRLEDAVLADARDERRHLGFAEVPPRLVRVRADARQRDLERTGPPFVPRRDERGEPAAEAVGALGSNGHDSTATSDSRANEGYRQAVATVSGVSTSELPGERGVGLTTRDSGAYVAIDRP